MTKKQKQVHKVEYGLFGGRILRCAGYMIVATMRGSQNWNHVTCKKCLRYKPSKR